MKKFKSSRIECEELTFCVIVGNGFSVLQEATMADAAKSWEERTAPFYTHRFLLGHQTVKHVNVLCVKRVQESGGRKKHCRRTHLPPTPEVGDTCEIVPSGILYEFGWQGQDYGWVVVD